MRITIWFLAQEIFDVKLEGREKPKPAVKERLGGAPFGDFAFGYNYDPKEVSVKDVKK